MIEDKLCSDKQRIFDITLPDPSAIQFVHLSSSYLLEASSYVLTLKTLLR